MVSYGLKTLIAGCRTVLILIVVDNGLLRLFRLHRGHQQVLILIVMDNGLLLFETKHSSAGEPLVLILIVMDNGLLPG